jgi:hypothetical protein
MASYETHLCVFNACNQNMSKITVGNTDNSDWDGDSRPDHNFNNVSINAFAYRNEREEINASNDSAMFTMNIQMSNGDILQIRGDQYDARDNKAGLLDIQAGNNNHLRYAGYQYCESDNMTWVIFQNIDSGTWMNALWSTIGNRQLCQIALPGTHDSGMYKLNYSTSMSTNDNTRTQQYNIAGQLSKGARYFDIRPMLWTSKVGSSDFYCGHFSNVVAVGLEGSLGESLSDVCSQVRAFVTASGNQNEVVILKFSHYMDIDNNGADFSADQKTSLKNYVLHAIGDLLYTNTNAETNIGTLSLSSIVNSGKRVIAVFDDMDSFADTSKGVFTFGSPSSYENFRLYDQYANSDSLSDMASDQINKLKNFTSSNGSMFLLSWTLTEQSTDIATTSIKNLAEKADMYLWYYLYYMVVSSPAIITTSKVPTVLYLDYFDSAYYFAEAAYFLNCYRHV